MKTVMTGALALLLLAQAAPAALAQDRPDRDAQPHLAPPPPRQAPPPQRMEAVRPPPATPQGQPLGQPRVQDGGPRYYRSEGGGWRGGDARVQGGFPQPHVQGQPPSPPPAQAVPVAPTAPQGQYRYTPGQEAWRGQPGGQQHEERWTERRDDHRFTQEPPRPDERYRRDDRHEDRDRHDDRDRHEDRYRQDERWRGYEAGRGWDRRDAPRYDRRNYPFEVWGHQRYRGFAYYPPRDFYVRRWVYGDIVPRHWWVRDYWIDDWFDFELAPPPYGYEWVRVGEDALLIDIYSGRVVEVAYGLFY